MGEAVRLCGAPAACVVFQVLLVLQPDRTPVVLPGGVITTVLGCAAVLRQGVLARRSTGRARTA